MVARSAVDRSLPVTTGRANGCFLPARSWRGDAPTLPERRSPNPRRRRARPNDAGRLFASLSGGGAPLHGGALLRPYPCSVRGPLRRRSHRRAFRRAREAEPNLRTGRRARGFRPIPHPPGPVLARPPATPRSRAEARVGALDGVAAPELERTALARTHPSPTRGKARGPFGSARWLDGVEGARGYPRGEHRPQQARPAEQHAPARRLSTRWAHRRRHLRLVRRAHESRAFALGANRFG